MSDTALLLALTIALNELRFAATHLRDCIGVASVQQYANLASHMDMAADGIESTVRSCDPLPSDAEAAEVIKWRS